MGKKNGCDIWMEFKHLKKLMFFSLNERIEHYQIKPICPHFNYQILLEETF